MPTFGRVRLFLYRLSNNGREIKFRKNRWCAREKEKRERERENERESKLERTMPTLVSSDSYIMSGHTVLLPPCCVVPSGTAFSFSSSVCKCCWGCLV
eukprot:sb/3478833/